MKLNSRTPQTAFMLLWMLFADAQGMNFLLKLITCGQKVEEQAKVDPLLEKYANSKVVKSRSAELEPQNLITRLATGQRHGGICPIKDVLTTGYILGKGANGTVELVAHKDKDAYYVRKAVPKSNDARFFEFLKREMDISLKLNHPFLGETYSVTQDEDHLYFLMKFYQGGEFFKNGLPKLRDLSDIEREKAARLYSLNAILALKQLHGKGIAHLDVKPENFMLNSEGYLILIDFGMARYVNEKNTDTKGTPVYMAPEQRDEEQTAGRPADIWALGIFMYEMLVGHLPFPEDMTKYENGWCYEYQHGLTFEEYVQTADAIEHSKKRAKKADTGLMVGRQMKTITRIKLAKSYYGSNRFSGKAKFLALPPGARNIIMMCLQSDPLKRPKIDDLEEHPWFAGINSMELEKRSTEMPDFGRLETRDHDKPSNDLLKLTRFETSKTCDATGLTEYRIALRGNCDWVRMRRVGGPFTGSGMLSYERQENEGTVDKPIWKTKDMKLQMPEGLTRAPVEYHNLIGPLKDFYRYGQKSEVPEKDRELSQLTETPSTEMSATG